MITSIYIHIPFCMTKCHYCDFISYPGITDNHIKQYIDSSCREIISYSNLISSQVRLDTIYIGGGTPSILPQKLLDQILKTICKNFKIENLPEVTIEINPGTITGVSIPGLTDMGFNRFSIGVQSLDDKILGLLWRPHSSKEALTLINDALSYGVNTSADLMFGIPGQRMGQWLDTLETVIKTGIPHISIYNLTLAKNTKMYSMVMDNKLQMPSLDTQADMYVEAIDLLENNGLLQYEVANFSIPGFECKHNLKYWRLEEFIGIGAGAHGFLKNFHYHNETVIGKYCNAVHMRGIGVADKEEISSRTGAFEAIMLGLRTLRGVDIADLEKRWGIDINKNYKKPIEKWTQNKMLVLNNNFLIPTKKGLLFADQIALDFL